jgi:hypothetical protein
MPIEAMAEAAVERAIGITAHTSVFEAELVVRASTAGPAGSAGAAPPREGSA